MESRPPAIYKPGDCVRVGVGEPSGHCRTPSYVRGKTGRVAKHYGAFLAPETLAYGKPGYPKQHLYQVEFDQAELWETYSGPPKDKLLIDIYQYWLEEA